MTKFYHTANEVSERVTIADDFAATLESRLRKLRRGGNDRKARRAAKSIRAELRRLEPCDA